MSSSSILKLNSSHMESNSYQFTQLYHRLDQRWRLLFSNIGCGFTFIIVCNSIVRVTNSQSSNLYLIFNLKWKFVKFQIVPIVIFLLSLVPHLGKSVYAVRFICSWQTALLYAPHTVDYKGTFSVRATCWHEPCVFTYLVDCNICF